MADPADDPKDNAGVIAPPPLIALAAVLVGLALDWLVPVYILATLMSFWTHVVLGIVLVIAGGALAISARRRFIEAGTNVEPWKPVVRLATAGCSMSTSATRCRGCRDDRRHRPRVDSPPRSWTLRWSWMVPNPAARP